jgi:hypothetical protein
MPVGRRATKAQDSIEEFKKGKSMLRDKHRYALICTATTILTALIGVPMFSPVPIVRANPGLTARPLPQRSGRSVPCVTVKMELALRLERV